MVNQASKATLNWSDNPTSDFKLVDNENMRLCVNIVRVSEYATHVTTKKSEC